MYLCTRNYDLKRGGTFETAKAGTFHSVTAGTSIPLFTHEKIGSNKVSVPEAFFKVVLCLNGKPKGLGLVVKNNAGTSKKDLYFNSIDEVERITGIDFFPILPNDLEKEVESTVNIDLWRH